MQFAENFQISRQEVYFFIMTMPDPIQPEQPRREFKNYSGNFLNIRLTARTWPLGEKYASFMSSFEHTIFNRMMLQAKTILNEVHIDNKNDNINYIITFIL
jgi:hypothetical protein